ncbi:MAG: glycoside hydrolase family 3 C-terminal domain-containing protein [Eubacteriales bacterium]|nr:glycoside hydrolase family 3 C-terminal domain-containing protein [Eubacteriales bacterium]
MRKIKHMTFTGVKTQEVQQYELRGRKIACEAAVEGIVLLKNEEQVLPLDKKRPVALYGSGAMHTIKGGTGSGDVNERSSVSIYEGMQNEGFEITTKSYLSDCEAEYETARQSWREEILKKSAGENGLKFFEVYSSIPFSAPAGIKIDREAAEKDAADTAVYVLSRVAGEGSDRYAREGDYLLSAEEAEQIKVICENYQNVILIINSGGIVDLSFTDTYKNIKGILYYSQAGMEGGNALARILSGKETPSAKLTDSWARNYEEYPNAATFSHNNGNVSQEKYEEGIYVGYRYFDSFEIPVRYPFGYGLSYTSFAFSDAVFSLDAGRLDTTPVITAKVTVTNTGERFAGKEVAEIFAVLPQTGRTKEFRRLVGFGKTGILQPGEQEELEISIPLKNLASYAEESSEWILEQGSYFLNVGNSVDQNEPVAVLVAEETCVLERLRSICTRGESLQEIVPDKESLQKRYDAYRQQTDGLPVMTLRQADINIVEPSYKEDYTGDKLEEAESITQTLSQEQLIRLVTGEIADWGTGNKEEEHAADQVGSAGQSVPGAAGETSHCAAGEPWNIAPIVLADGPAGLRLNQKYRVVNGEIQRQAFRESLEHGIFAENPEEVRQEGEVYYQYCTAIPVGTMLAQTFNPELVEKVGRMIGEEMVRFHITLWLAPGMNIHRNPLCGRNFEYYSEDPLLSGIFAASMTKGVQSVAGCGTTIKHFACNNQEDNRMNSDSVVSERALREIYLRGFEIAVKEAQPMAIMTSFNKINGVHAANHYDLCTIAARQEWGFDGIIMTDWLTTSEMTQEGSTASGCIRAGNDLVMPGLVSDHEDLKRALLDGSLTIEELKKCVVRIVRTVLKSNQYE